MNKLTQCRLRAIEADLSSYAAAASHVADAIYRGLAINERLTSLYKPEDKVPSDVLDYIKEFEESHQAFYHDSIKIDSSCEGVIEVVRNVISELWRLLCRLYEMVKHCLRWLLSAQYRAAKQAIKYRQKICLMKSSVSAIQQFEEYEARTMPRPEDFKAICQATNNIITLLIMVSEQKSATAIDGILTIQAPMCGFSFANNHLTDNTEDIEVFTDSYKRLGWTATTADELAKMYIDCTGRTVKLKNIQGDIDKDVSDLKHKMNSKIADGADSNALADLQNKLLCKTKALNVIKDGIEVVGQRITFLDRIMGRLATDAGAIADGRDPSTVEEDFAW